MTTGDVADGIGAGCLLAGAALTLLAGVGIVRFPDVLSRMHAATKPQVLGVLLVMIGFALRLRSSSDIATLAVIVVFQMIAAPVAAHMVARGAYRAGNVRREYLVVDELTRSLESEDGRPAQRSGRPRRRGDNS